MNKNNNAIDLGRLLRMLPDAIAVMYGSRRYPQIYGSVRFYRTANGTLTVADVSGLPSGDGACDSPILAFHIHGGDSCTGNEEDPFANAGTHYDPNFCPHPYHAGDLPPLFSSGGKAFLAVLTDRFGIDDVVGKTVVIHSSPDDFTTQPSGNAGEKIACGVIVPTRRR